MYERHFSLDQRPFNLRPDASFLYLSDQHRMALRLLEYGLFEQDGYSVVTGEIGCGKSMLVRYLLDQVGDQFQIGLIANTHASFGGLLHWVTGAFGLPRENRSESELYDDFVEFLMSGYRRGKQTLLIVDEAQNLGVGSLEEIRVLSNINADGAHIIQLLLVGQPELRDILNDQRLRQVAQRISSHYHLDPLTTEQVSAYIHHRLVVAGARRPIFTQQSMRLVAEASGGVPRLINQICDSCLVYAYAGGHPHVLESTVRQVVKDRRDSRVLPLQQASVRDDVSLLDQPVLS